MIKNTLTLSIFICLSILGTTSVYGDTTQGNEKHLIKELQNEVVVVNVSKPGALYEEAPDTLYIRSKSQAKSTVTTYVLYVASVVLTNMEP